MAVGRNHSIYPCFLSEHATTVLRMYNNSYSHLREWGKLLVFMKAQPRLTQPFCLILARATILTQPYLTTYYDFFQE